MRRSLAIAVLIGGMAAMTGESWSMTCFAPETHTQIADYDFWTVAVWTPSKIATENEGSRNQMVTVEAEVAFSEPAAMSGAMRVSQNGFLPDGLATGEVSVVLLGGYESDPPIWSVLAVTSPGDDAEATARSCAASLAGE